MEKEYSAPEVVEMQIDTAQVICEGSVVYKEGGEDGFEANSIYTSTY